MIYSKIGIKCELCGNKQQWYIMPLTKKINKNDFIYSPTKFKIVCKKCNKTYFLEFKIKSI